MDTARTCNGKVLGRFPFVLIMAHRVLSLWCAFVWFSWRLPITQSRHFVVICPLLSTTALKIMQVLILISLTVCVSSWKWAADTCLAHCCFFSYYAYETLTKILINLWHTEEMSPTIGEALKVAENMRNGKHLNGIQGRTDVVVAFEERKVKSRRKGTFVKRNLRPEKVKKELRR